MERVLALVKLADPVLWSVPAMLFAVAYLSTGNVRLPLLLGGIVYIVLADVATLWWNKYTDREEDRINSPHRIDLAEVVGFETIRRLALSLYAALALGAVAAGWWIRPVLGLILGLMVWTSWAYSSGPRFKQRTWTALIFFPLCLVVFPFAAGWVINEPLVELPLVAWVPLIYFLSFGTLRNFPDQAGDQRAGMKTLPKFITDSRNRWVILAILLAPYLAVLALVLGRVVPLRFLAVFWTLAILALVLAAVVRAAGAEELQTVRALEQLQRWAFISTLMLVYHPAVPTFWIVVLGTIYRFVVLRSGFDTRGLTIRLDHVAAVLRAGP